MTSPCPLRQVVESGKPFRSFQSLINSKKEEVPFAVDCYPFKNEEGKVVQAVSILRDLCEASKIESELGRMYRFAAMGELFPGIAHNLNTPLSAVMARAEMLLERLEGLKKGEEERENSFESKLDKSIRDAGVIVANATKLSVIIRNMMQKGLRESEETPQMLNLSHLLKEELQFLESDMKFKHELKKSYSLDESVPFIDGVYFHFSQSFVNIIRNVMESIDKSEVKELSISCKHDKDNIYIEIHDTGLEANMITQENQPYTAAEKRLAQTRELLKPYDAELKIRSEPHDNLHAIRIPCKKP
jgi:signal transduction histidine kinase